MNFDNNSAYSVHKTKIAITLFSFLYADYSYDDVLNRRYKR